MISTTDLELKTNLTLGELTSNAESIRAFVMERLKDFTPEKYAGKPDEAKKDRAVLNAAKDTLNKRRLELERQYLEPFTAFKDCVNETVKAIKEASANLDAIVKAEEEKESAVKKELISSLWEETHFELFPLEKVFNEKWLNKTFKVKDIIAEINAIQKKAMDDLKILENFPAEDVALLKINYLETLDITQAMNKANELKANRDRLAQEKVLREQIETINAMKEQRKEEYADKRDAECDDLASLALNQVEPDKKIDFACVISGTMKDIQDLRSFMTNRGLVYNKLDKVADGIFQQQENIF